jgi:hypothetical protein
VPTERDDAIFRFFDDQRGQERTAGDAAALVAERLQRLAEELEVAGELGEDADRGARADREATIHDAALSLGRACVDALNGLVVSGAVDMVVLRPAAVPAEAPAIDASWQRTSNPFMALVEISMTQQRQIETLRDQPDRLYRLLLNGSLALAADVAAWTMWTQL